MSERELAVVRGVSIFKVCEGNVKLSRSVPVFDRLFAQSGAWALLPPGDEQRDIQSGATQNKNLHGNLKFSTTFCFRQLFFIHAKSFNLPFVTATSADQQSYVGKLVLKQSSSHTLWLVAPADINNLKIRMMSQSPRLTPVSSRARWQSYNRKQTQGASWERI